MTKPAEFDVKELRAWADERICVPRYFTFDRDGLRFLADVLDLADNTQRAVIECHLIYEGEGAAIWYDTTRVDDCDRDMVDQAIAYLEARGQLTRKPGAPEWVRPWGEDGP